MTSTFISTALLAASVFLAVVVNRDWTSQESFTTSTGVTHDGQAPAPADSMSLMQGKPVVERLSEDKELDPVTKRIDSSLERLNMYEKELAMLTKDTDPSSDKAAPVLLESATTSSIRALALRVQNRVGVKAATGMVVVLVLLILILLCGVSSLLLGFPFGRRRQQDSAGSPQSSKDIMASLEARDRMGAYTSPMPGSRTYQRAVSGASLTAHEPFLRADLSPHSGSLLPGPREMALSSTSITEQHRHSAKPPALCPTLVMPMSEALLGIQMYELAQLNQEGSLNIVGISGKPLLRAEIKKNGNTRTLEIAMPEPNSIPRASIGPPTMGESSQYGSRVLEIRGMRGAFYGSLEMRSSGACYVVKDGQTVLTIDGDAESLQLSLKSSVGLQLAAVRCSTEQFEGVDHVEIRVEPGVDTVLVVAVVLAVLLLSPYLPPADD